MSERRISTTLSVLGELSAIVQRGCDEVKTWAHRIAPNVSAEYGKGVADATTAWTHHVIEPLFERMNREAETESLMDQVNALLKDK